MKRADRTLAALVALISAIVLTGASSAESDESDHEWREVVRVVDGDTLLLDGDERVRRIGVDTPETVHPQKPVEYFGKEASEFTRRMSRGSGFALNTSPALASEIDTGEPSPTSTWRAGGS